MLQSGEWVRGLRTRGTPSEAEIRSRGRGRAALERGGVSPEGGGQPSSEAEIRPRGRVALE
jgi:hypothetical protein